MPDLTITADAIRRIARDVFGSGAEVESILEIRPQSQYGIPKVCGCNANLSFRVQLRGDSQAYLFRFNRGFREDLYDKEASNYRLVAEHTDIPIPRIARIDRTQQEVPTSFMIMDYMAGDEAFYLSHPANPCTDHRDKAAIQGQLGHCYAQIHHITRAAPSPQATTDYLLYRLEQLEHVVQDGQFAIDLDKIRRCRDVVQADTSLRLDVESLCVGDAEIHLCRRGSEWQVSFICDMEWVDFGDPYFDLVALACAPARMYEIEHPLRLTPQQLALKPSLVGYGRLCQIDYGRLVRMAIYAQLAVMCSITDQVYRPEKRGYMQSREPAYVALLDAVVAAGAS